MVAVEIDVPGRHIHSAWELLFFTWIPCRSKNHYETIIMLHVREEKTELGVLRFELQRIIVRELRYQKVVVDRFCCNSIHTGSTLMLSLAWRWRPTAYARWRDTQIKLRY